MSNRTTPLTEPLYDYLLDHSLRESEAARALREETATLSKRSMQIAPEQGQFMQMLARLTGATSYIDVGVFTGYSSLVMAEMLPANGRILGCDLESEWTDIARKHWETAGISERIELVLAPALETLNSRIEAGEAGQWDMAFIDADKAEYIDYYEACLTLVRPGGLILADNTLWNGNVADPAVDDEDTQAIRAFNAHVHGDDRVDLSLVPIGDGLTLLRRRSPTVQGSR